MEDWTQVAIATHPCARHHEHDEKTHQLQIWQEEQRVPVQSCLVWCSSAGDGEEVHQLGWEWMHEQRVCAVARWLPAAGRCGRNWVRRGRVIGLTHARHLIPVVDSRRRITYNIRAAAIVASWRTLTSFNAIKGMHRRSHVTITSLHYVTRWI